MAKRNKAERRRKRLEKKQTNQKQHDASLLERMISGELLPSDPLDLADEDGDPLPPDRDHVQVLSYDIVTEPYTVNPPLPDEVMAQVQETNDLLYDDPEKVIGRLQNWIEKYPETRELYNWLTVAYQSTGKQKQADRLIESSYRKFPDYIFARTAYAHLLLSRDQFEKVPEVFDNKFDLKALYPNRDKFHVSEFIDFTSVMCEYFWNVGEEEVAERYLGMLEEMAPDHPVTERLVALMSFDLVQAMTQAMSRLMMPGSRKRKPKKARSPSHRGLSAPKDASDKDHTKPAGSDAAPLFEHSERDPGEARRRTVISKVRDTSGQPEPKPHPDPEDPMPAPVPPEPIPPNPAPSPSTP